MFYVFLDVYIYLYSSEELLFLSPYLCLEAPEFPSYNNSEESHFPFQGKFLPSLAGTSQTTTRILVLMQNFCIRYTFNNDNAAVCVLGCSNLLCHDPWSSLLIVLILALKQLNISFLILVDVLGLLLLQAKPFNTTCSH